ncbi:hypothetical protein B1B_07924, partial [mine drainage metagenome]
MSEKYYREPDSKLTLKEISNQIRKYWDENNIFNKVNDRTRFDKEFIFLEGPPTANG